MNCINHILNHWMMVFLNYVQYKAIIYPGEIQLAKIRREDFYKREKERGDKQ